MIGYFLQVVFSQLLFLLVYEVLLKRETFFNWNRWYLIMTAAISFLLPFLKLEELSFLITPNALPEISDIWWSNLALLESGISGSTPAREINGGGAEINWFIIIYSAGVFGSIYLLKKKYNELERLFRFRTIASEEGWKIIEIPNSNIASTFYKTIFLGDQLTENERQQIFPHELVHVKQKHSIDLLFFEFLKVVLWFNPLVYIYQNRISTLHEFIADAAVVRETGKRNYYEQLQQRLQFPGHFIHQSIF
ncbi:hypothetical protein LZ575_18780 [Antarcticibacterium sp. 1MA-6-2]|uniref:M56 family metallopeptidase n=1 Tax=Antarcticibacterium sp. 1MA-6-2 TaxID=2908210 RepID=UPI001F2744F1|nr:M56 family metallopeptidase [Antarcticibacterium sp. 1MA-6-2]UJH90776.1 hypothetical protein LZ575_18780 [Antarcticibacterium sp. 1MA-6-2]